MSNFFSNRNNYKRNSSNLSAKPSNWWAWLLALIGFLLLFPLFRYLKSQLQKNQEQQVKIEIKDNFIENQNPEKAQSKADNITTRKDVQQAAKDLAHHLGTKYTDNPTWSWSDPSSWSIFDVRGWTENDAEVERILRWQRLNYSFLQRLYNQVYTANRNLSDDIRKYLDTKELKKVNSYLNL